MPGRPPVDKQKIRELAKQGVQADQIARRTGVSRGSVYAVLRAEKGKVAK